MKKISLILGIASIFAFTAEAQTNKQVAGSKSFEVMLAPLGGQPISLANGIKFRSFSSETSAFRLSVFVGFNSSKDAENQFLLSNLSRGSGMYNMSEHASLRL